MNTFLSRSPAARFGGYQLTWLHHALNPQAALLLSAAEGDLDFGLDKLVEMIEERFGRKAGTVVLAAIAISDAYEQAKHTTPVGGLVPANSVAASWSDSYLHPRHAPKPDM